MSQYTDSLTAEQLIDYIARDYVELSHDKIRIQRDSFMRICKDWMFAKDHAEQLEAYNEAASDQPETDYSGWADYWEGDDV